MSNTILTIGGVLVALIAVFFEFQHLKKKKQI